MSTIAVIVDNGFEDSEYAKPVQAFKKAKHQVVNVGFRKGSTVTGKNCKEETKIDVGLKSADPEKYDALFIPGGYSPDHLRTDSTAVSFAKAFMDKKKPVFSICHGAQLLITAKALEGRKATGWKSIEQDMRYAKADYRDEEVVVDDNLVSSRGPKDIPAFITQSLKKLS